MVTDNLPPLPLDWTSSATPSANGAFHVYLVDANGRKVGALWGTSPEKQAMAKAICAFPRGLEVLKDCADWLLEAAHILEQVGRSGEARDIRINARNCDAVLRLANEGHTTDLLALAECSVHERKAAVDLINGCDTGTDATEAP